MATVQFQLDSDKIVETIQLLERRISERFPSSGLVKVCGHLLEIGRNAQTRAQQISEPILSVRLLTGVVGCLVFASFAYTIVSILMGLDGNTVGAPDMIQMLEAGFNSVLLVGATVLFLLTLETRIKRRRALKALHELRAIAHVIDMHQLTKDPERLIKPGTPAEGDTRSSPKRTMTPFELNRYLDYSSEMLSLAGKIAALYAQDFDDASVVAAVNDIEDLTSGLSRKIWQKIMLLHELTDRALA